MPGTGYELKRLCFDRAVGIAKDEVMRRLLNEKPMRHNAWYLIEA